MDDSEPAPILYELVGLVTLLNEIYEMKSREGVLSEQDSVRRLSPKFLVLSSRLPVFSPPCVR